MSLYESSGRRHSRGGLGLDDPQGNGYDQQELYDLGLIDQPIEPGCDPEELVVDETAHEEGRE